MGVSCVAQIVAGVHEIPVGLLDWHGVFIFLCMISSRTLPAQHRLALLVAGETGISLASKTKLLDTMGVMVKGVAHITLELSLWTGIISIVTHSGVWVPRVQYVHRHSTRHRRACG
jgi:hypothetical protein